MPQPAQSPAISERIYVDGEPVSVQALPVRTDRRVHDKGAHMMQMLHKRAEDTLDYFINLQRWLEPGESVTACRSYVDMQAPLEGEAGGEQSAFDNTLYVEKLEFAGAGVVIWLRGGGDGRRYTVCCRVQTSRGKLKLIRFVMITNGEAVKVAYVNCTVIGGGVGVISEPDPVDPEPEPEPTRIRIDITDAVFVTETDPDPEPEPEFGNGPIILRALVTGAWTDVTDVSFPVTEVGQTASLSLRFVNTGSLPVIMSLPAVTAPFALNISGSGSTRTIAPGNYAGGVLAFTPAGAGSWQAVMNFTYGTDGLTAQIGITAQGKVTEPDPEPVGELTRVRIAGNRFYAIGVSDPDNGVLPAGAQFIRLRSINWFGAEGTNFTPHGTWARRYTDIIDQIAGWGFNCIRLPFSGDFCAPGRTPPETAIDFDLNPEFAAKTALEILDLIIAYCTEKKLYIVLDHHRRRAGDGADGGPTDASYSAADWRASWSVMASRYGSDPAIVGADVHNEPHNLDWATWAGLAESCGNHIHTIAPDWIIFVEGVGAIGDDHYWWGGQLAGVRTRPLTLGRAHRIAYSPHEYGQSVGSQQWLAYENQTPPSGWPNNLYSVWDAHWGFIHYEGIAPVWIGEMGGHFGLDAQTGALNKPHRVQETAWMTTLVQYLNGQRTASAAPVAAKMSFAWWSYNPNSADTGGMIQGDWATPQQPKLNLIQPLLTT